jgi:peptidoglycan/LPS O-acetylase OafA/YrhL
LALPAVFGQPGRGLIRRMIESRPLQLVGLISFGIYLYHQPMITFVYDLAGAKHVFGGTKFPNGPDFPFPVMVVMVALATAACATASYVLVEARFLRRKHRPAKTAALFSEPAATTQPSEPR